MVSPGWEHSRPGLSSATPTTKTCRYHPKKPNPLLGDPGRWGPQYSAKGPVSRILSCAVIPLGAALPRTLISDLPGGSGTCLSRLGAPGRCAAPPGSLADASLPIWSCSVWGLPCPGPYGPSGALLPHHFTLTPALGLAGRANPSGSPGRPSRKRGSRGGIFSVALAVHEP